ncbi:AMP-binding protein [Pseudonocardia sp. RS11V-5]|uniref:class I adenylate-forming enzyme family protein n=1 Tax=Pseudonocardia terrae TaxID=2905831 RepID=UPI001E475A9D|nr:AMP-binding protein [Pseudonocardia terrae]MCE3554662.1 AMP-binding protein [Pseudonocardia terrae]
MVPLARILEQTARRHHEADKPALVGPTTSWTYRETADRMWRLARALRELGAGPGDRVAVLASNSADYLVLFAAVSALGAATVPMSPRWTAAEVAGAVAYVRPAVLVASAEHVTVAAAAVSELAGAEGAEAPLLTVLDGDLVDRAARAGAVPFPVPDDPEAPIWLAFTGGTTGTMKACVVDAGTFTENILFCSLQFGFGREDVTLACGSYGHMLPLYFSLMQLYCGGTVVVLGEFDARAVLPALERHGVTWLAAVPTIYGDLVRAQPEVRADLSTLRFCISAGSPLLTEAKQRLLDVLTPNLYEYYGATETGWTTLLEPRDQLRKHRCVGQPMSGVDLQVVREDGTPCEVGEIGLVRKRGLVLMREYLDHPELTSEIIGAAGWATAGDLGRLDEEGYLYLVDRQKDMIISGGVNVYPNEIEEVLLAVPGTEEVAVVGIPHERWGEAVHAVAVLASGTDAEDWEGRAREAAATSLAGYKRPKSYAVVDALPRAHSGKLLKREIRAPYRGPADTVGTAG